MDVHQEKVAIVTGACSGIGKATSLQLLADGWKVYGLDIGLNQGFEGVNGFIHVYVDLTDLEMISEVVSQILLSTELNLLVNCAGIREICSIDELSIDIWTKVISLNVTSVFYLSKLVEAKVRAVGASLNIVNIASVSGMLGEPNRTAYVTSKHALIGLTKQLAIEYGKYGVRVNSISPGVIRTPLTEQYFHDQEQVTKIMAGQFLEKSGTTEDVASAVLYLASNQASFITGSNFVVDGGWSAGKLI